MEKLLLSPEEAAAALGIGRTLLYEMLARQELPRVMIGKRTKIPAAALADWVHRNTLAARSDVPAAAIAERPAITAITGGSANRRTA